MLIASGDLALEVSTDLHNLVTNLRSFSVRDVRQVTHLIVNLFYVDTNQETPAHSESSKVSVSVCVVFEVHTPVPPLHDADMVHIMFVKYQYQA